MVNGVLMTWVSTADGQYWLRRTFVSFYSDVVVRACYTRYRPSTIQGISIAWIRGHKRITSIRTADIGHVQHEGWVTVGSGGGCMSHVEGTTIGGGLAR